ncbi:putative thiol--disulfide interchange protein [Acinetobacter guillouiae]|uniref:DsbC family protein n=1 Tax=Acinetobacter guillouiae TaxID=106649 RepID=UPI0004EF6082|nr:DsbC family protein [Acinetobacter guillouiae]BAP35692.1 putative thiol--disulfide interchange protein [Acinetobacter guillouiae]
MKIWLSLLTLGLFTFSSAHADIQTLQQNLKTKYPEIQVKSVQNSPIKDVYEVYMGGRIVYTNEEAKYFFVGNLIDLKEQKNLTEERMQTLKSIDVKSLPLKQAIKHVKGKGERVIYVFSDPDCPYCQNLEKELKNIDNLTVYLFLYPITRLHPNAESISQQIWCSKNQYQAWEDYLIDKKQPSANKSCTTPIEKNIALAKSLEVDGTPTFFLQDGTRISGAREAGEIELLLKAVK